MVEVRSLQTRDVFAVARILGRVARGNKVQLMAVITGKQVDPSAIALDLFGVLFTDAESDIKAWCADLCGKTVEEFDALPPDTIFEIIDQLKSREDMKGFLGRVSRLISTTKTAN